MRRNTSLILLTAVAMAGLGTVQAAEVIALGPQTTGLEVQEDSDEIIHVRVAEVRLDGVEIDGVEWAFVRAPSAQNSMERGLPSLPFLTSRYLLDRTGGISLELVNRKVRSVDLSQYGYAGVVPSKGHFDRGIDPASVPWIFDDKIYTSDIAFPAGVSRIDDPFISGPVRGQSLQIPVVFWQADTNTLTVVEEAWFKVVHTTDASNPRVGADRPLTGLFYSAVRSNTVNYESFAGRYDSFVETGRLLIIADDAFIDEVQPLADWETLVGYPTMLVPVSAAGSTGAEIKSYIQSLYDEPAGLTWIILVGDIQQIPSLTGVNEGATCDACYTKLDGADNRPDAAISRISAQTEAQATVQVSKILDYEQLPDTGSAAAWYSKAFGVAGDDIGGNPSYSDWARMNFLRDDLVDPAYTFTEFDEIYHYPPSSDVADSVNAGRSLGLYIGHGSETSWSTSGFSVSDINSDLTNADTLPVIWSVACVNGRFDRSGGDCFGEAWLKKDGGGAVSFEGATTNESWVPPCDAQRGIIDSLRNETAFTTGGQLVNGKLYCMDVNGHLNSSEGTRFMEQSTLFGTATTWPRTLEARSPNEPDDFVSGGGMATLTVKVEGAALSKAGAAIVSFYNEVGGINVVGSGLIDANGVVTAPVSGDPTHCHIHGQNLIPMSFELAAREEGRVGLDAAVYSCTGTVTVRVSDSNVTGSSPGTVDTTTVELTAGGSPFVANLTETAADRNIYVGTAVLGSDLTVAHGDTITASYIDANDGAGGVNLTRSAEAAIDCAGPMVSDLSIDKLGANEVTVRWSTDEPGNSWAQINPGAAVANDSVLVTEHELVFDGLEPCTMYTITVASSDAYGNAGISAQTQSFRTWESAVAFDDDVESGEGAWTVDTDEDPGAAPNWGIVVDPDTSSPGYSWFTSDETNVKDDRLVAGPFSLGGGSPVLSFWHHFDTEGGYDGGVLEVSTDGVTWVDVEVAGGIFLTGGYDDSVSAYSSNPLAGREFWAGSGSLQEVQVDLTTLAGGDLWIRFRFGCDSSVAEEGWWVGDIKIETTAPCSTNIFSDGFEGGDCTFWSLRVGEI